jgi:Zinc finger, C3HC4 type (RING finger)
MFGCNELIVSIVVTCVSARATFVTMTSAASDYVGTQLNQVVECSICTEVYCDPRLLPCMHSYCLKCIEDISRDKLPGDSIACPLCGKHFTLPTGGVDELPTNSFLEHLKKKRDSNRYVPTCDCCLQHNKNLDDTSTQRSAKVFCKQCQQNLCQTCVDAHQLMTGLRPHLLIDICSESRRNSTAIAVGCEMHGGNALDMYCFQCKTAICMTCCILVHKTHDCVDVSEVADEFRDVMTEDEKSVSEAIRRCRKFMKDLASQKTHLNRQADCIEKKLCARAEKLKQLIDNEKQQLFDEITARKRDRNSQIDKVMGEIEQHVSFAENLVKYAAELRGKGTNDIILQQSTVLHIRADELTKLDELHQAVDDVHSSDIWFEEAKLPTTQRIRSFIGKIELDQSGR